MEARSSRVRLRHGSLVSVFFDRDRVAQNGSMNARRQVKVGLFLRENLVVFLRRLRAAANIDEVAGLEAEVRTKFH